MATFLWSSTENGFQEAGSADVSTLRIGRATNAELRFSEPLVDLEHATISLEDRGFVLRDLGSTTGVWIDGERVRERRLRHGDVVELGGYVLQVQLGGEEGPLILEITRASDRLGGSGFHTFRASGAALLAFAELEAAKQGDSRVDVSALIPQILPSPSPPPFADFTSGMMLPRRPRMDAEGWTDVLPTITTPARPEPELEDFDPYARTTALEIPPGGFPPPPPVGPSSPPAREIPATTAAFPTVAATPFPPEAPTRGSAVFPLSPPSSTLPAGGSRPGSAVTSPAIGGPPAAGGGSGVAAPPAMAPRSSIDYPGAYRLPTLGVKVAATLAFAVLFGIFLQASRSVQGDLMFAPGALAAAHQSATCGDCHQGWRPVAESSCQHCHGQTGAHQTVMTAAEGAPDCQACHLEHRGGDRLRFRENGSCADCHGGLTAVLPTAVQLQERVVDIHEFAQDHPQFAVDVGGERRRLDEPGVRQGDLVGLSRFNHQWHISGLPARDRRDCGSCHRRDADDEIAPISFETSCRSCHALSFDPRFPGQQAKHGAPIEVFDGLIGFYSRREEVLGRLAPDERNSLGNASLSNERRLTQLARLVGERLLRTNCVKCHEMSRPPGTDAEATVVEPVGARLLFFPRTPFSHRTHTALAPCADCHALAPQSRVAEDLLVPGIEACRTCHQPEPPASVEAAQRGGSRCIDCHTYHPFRPDEAAPRVASSTSPSTLPPARSLR